MTRLATYSDSAIVNQGILEASVGLLDKPFSAADLLRKVRRVLDDRAAETS